MLLQAISFWHFRHLHFLHFWLQVLLSATTTSRLSHLSTALQPTIALPHWGFWLDFIDRPKSLQAYLHWRPLPRTLDPDTFLFRHFGAAVLLWVLLRELLLLWGCESVWHPGVLGTSQSLIIWLIVIRWCLRASLVLVVRGQALGRV